MARPSALDQMKQMDKEMSKMKDLASQLGKASEQLEKGDSQAAAQELAKDNRFTAMTIKREIGHDDRGITADGVCMFWQVAVGAVLSSRHTLI